MPGWIFGFWCGLCLVGSTDFAGQARVTVQTALLAWLGIAAEAGRLSEAVLALGVQKAPHVLFFGLLGWIAAVEISPARRRWFLGIGVLVCVVAELLQGLTETRSLWLGDLVLNLVTFGAGALLATRKREPASETQGSQQ